MNKLKIAYGVLISFLIVGCGDVIKDAANGISDPTERGCMYIATAIVIGAIIRTIANK